MLFEGLETQVGRFEQNKMPLKCQKESGQPGCAGIPVSPSAVVALEPELAARPCLGETHSQTGVGCCLQRARLIPGP